MRKTNLEELIADAGRTVALSDTDRESLRERIVEYMEFTPLRTTASTAAIPYRAGIFDSFTARYVPALVIAGLVLSGAGVSSAAESALPGDLLYSIKINVNEEVISALTADPIERAVWQASRAERRLSEIGSLAKAGLLDTDRVAVAARTFSQQADKAAQLVTELSKQDPFAAAEVTTEMETALESHEMILAQIDGGEAGATKVIADRARDEAQRIAQLREEVESVIVPAHVAMEAHDAIAFSAPEATGTAKMSAMMQAPEDSLPAVSDESGKKAAERMRSAALRALERLAASGADEAAALEEGITTDIDAGAVALSENDPAAAYELFRSAFTRASRAVRLLEAEANLDIELPVEEVMERAQDPQDSLENDPVINPEAHSMREAARAQASALTALSALEDALAASSGDRTLADAYREAEQNVARADAAYANGDGAEASALYARVVRHLRDILGERESGHSGSGVEESALFGKTLYHRYADGIHVFRGTVITPSPCYAVSADAVVQESNPEQITVVVKWEKVGGMCIHTSVEKEFAVAVTASQNAAFAGVYIDGALVAADVVEEPLNAASSSIRGISSTSDFQNQSLRSFPEAPVDSSLLQKVTDMLEDR